MYNRYIPTADGAYRRETVLQTVQEAEAPPVVQQSRQGLFPRLPRLETEDLLVLAVLAILLLNGDGNDRIATLVTIAAFLLL